MRNEFRFLLAVATIEAKPTWLALVAKPQLLLCNYEQNKVEHLPSHDTAA
ncbi:hypothetical protein [Campylobacter rectus]|nr:hypothetical protein [Campylobacter rectus]